MILASCVCARVCVCVCECVCVFLNDLMPIENGRNIFHLPQTMSK